MTYYVLGRSSSDDAPEMDTVEPLGVWPIDEFAGKPFPKTFPEPVVTLSSLARLDDVWYAGPWLLMSRSFISLLRNCGESRFEEWPVSLRSFSGQVNRESHRLINLLENVSCLDKRASQVELNQDGYIRKITRLAIETSRIPPDRHLFRMAEKRSVKLASAALKRVWEAAGLRGARFQPLDGYCS